MTDLTVNEQLARAHSMLDKVLPTYKGIVRPLLDRMQVALPDIEMMGAYIRGGHHLRDADGKPIDYIPADHFAYYMRPKRADQSDGATAGQIVPCPFCGARVYINADPRVGRALLIIACPNVTSPDPPAEYAGQEVCDWHDRVERTHMAALGQQPAST